MCKATSELKFCTCAVDEDEEPENYWMLYSKKSNEDGLFTTTMGLVTWVEHDEVKKETLKAFIISSLNKENCFDIHLNILDRDVLEIGLCIAEEHYRYYLEYLNDKWQECGNDIDQFAIMDMYDRVSEGITKPSIYEYFKSKI
jgi:hypothetical protein